MSKNPALSTLSHVKKGPKWSFCGRPDETRARQNASDLPGPGQYGNPVSTANRNIPATVFGCTKRDTESKSAVPGPGTYNVDGGLKKVAPAFSCTPRRMVQSGDFDFPGPGAHSLPGLVGSGPKHKFSAQERSSSAGFQYPGPAEYSVLEAEPKGPKWRLGTAVRDQQSATETPGPGSYVTPSSLGGPKYSAAPKREESRVVETPGPVTYAVKSTIGKSQKHSYSMSARYEKPQEKPEEVPGPGHYSARAPCRQSPMYGFGTSTRHDPDKKSSRIPGPGAYTPASKSQQNIFRFASGERPGIDNKGFPGPGEYNVQATAVARRTSPKYTLGGRYQTAEYNQTKQPDPGPGEYNQDGSVKPSPRWGFGTQARLAANNKAHGPGPGTYAPQRSTNGPKFGFPRSKRKPLAETDTPGPGAHGGVSTQFLP